MKLTNPNPLATAIAFIYAILPYLILGVLFATGQGDKIVWTRIWIGPAISLVVCLYTRWVERREPLPHLWRD